MHSNIFSNQYILNKMNKFEEFKNGKVAISHDVTAEEMKIILTEAFPEDLAREDQKEVYNRKDKIYYREETLSEMHGHSIWCTIFPEWKSIKTYKASEILEELNTKTFAEWCDYISSPAIKLQMYQNAAMERFKHYLTQTDSIERHPCHTRSKEHEYCWKCGMLEANAELDQEAIKALQNQKNRYKGLFVFSTVIYFIIVFYLLIR